MHNMVKISLKTLKLLHVIGKFVGIWPAFNTNTMDKCGRHYIYGILALLCVICEYIFVLIGKTVAFRLVDTSVFIMIILSDLAMTVTNITSIVNINFLQGDTVYHFLQDMKQLEVIFLNVHKENKRHQWYFYMDIVICHVVFILYMIYNMWEWTHLFGWRIGRYTLVRDIQFYHIFLTVLLIRNYVLLIQYKVKAVNYVLENITSNGKSSKERRCSISMIIESGSICGTPAMNISLDPSWDLEYISKIYTKLANVIQQFNSIFGWNLVVLEIQLVINLLLALHLAFIYEGVELLGQKMDYNYFIICFIWFITPLVNMFTLISTCDVTKREINKMPQICYNLILESNDKEFIKKLKDLALQGYIQSPDFTAAGFFRINYTLVFPTMSAIISYFIVLIQFKNS